MNVRPTECNAVESYLTQLRQSLIPKQLGRRNFNQAFLGANILLLIGFKMQEIELMFRVLENMSFSSLLITKVG